MQYQDTIENLIVEYSKNRPLENVSEKNIKKLELQSDIIGEILTNIEKEIKNSNVDNYKLKNVKDPLSDSLTKLKNASWSSHESVILPGTTLNASLMLCLLGSKMISEVIHVELHKRSLIVGVFNNNGETTPFLVKRVSKPGRRVYISAKDLPSLLQKLGINELGILILSTSSGLKNQYQAINENVGGEIIGFFCKCN